jgi:hypothetical protein
MAQRPKGCDSQVMAADGQVFTGRKNVYALVISTEGATAGDVIVLREGGAEGAVKLRCSVELANGSIPIPLGKYGKEFLAGCYYSELAAAAGKIWTTVIFD